MYMSSKKSKNVKSEQFFDILGNKCGGQIFPLPFQYNHQHHLYNHIHHQNNYQTRYNNPYHHKKYHNQKQRIKKVPDIQNLSAN
ncbi:hypothetical protein BpHYR1_008699 [Brachionus plicatilis]|uniref:Uncharacterized protein n=1 Tax=Brachionus plicatilis TaxID=10195 RepID=A0A3M7TAW3_BRAPC|nr:hypothetical protein BpHYR1_008699 [Brachionus plicatilis]